MDNRKKVGVLTLYHNNTNFGATLQAYALQQKIKEQGYTTCVVDFIPTSRGLSTGQKFLFLILHPWRLPRVVYRRLRRTDYIEDSIKKEWNRLWKEKWEKWKQFCCQHIDVTDSIPECDLSEHMNGYDILLTGSDQVWNPGMCSDAHFLPFEKKKRLKVAYAASISRSSLTEKQKMLFRRWLPEFDYITVREKEGKELLESFLNVKVDVVLDPTLLFTADDWSKIAEPLVVRNQVSYRRNNLQPRECESNYILFAALGTNPSHRRFAARLAERMRMNLVILSTTLQEMKANKELIGDELIDVSPGQYLSLVQNASLVITDSFHCMAFSINFHRAFFVLKRDLDTDKNNMNSRLYTLLGELGLESQLVDPKDADKVQMPRGLYEGIDEKLSDLRLTSEMLLRTMLSLNSEDRQRS